MTAPLVSPLEGWESQLSNLFLRVSSLTRFNWLICSNLFRASPAMTQAIAPIGKARSDRTTNNQQLTTNN
ncbi:hypothetical protein [Kamptonema sp. PCC 6506]|uniref:hypothetical protein n=1 Tax=Kamptonema sp. PCC 6506 TaxID=272129 RepID=UPI0002E0B72D|nr:hypothetical protein [Kamptonema sp. PCC 6506]